MADSPITLLKSGVERWNQWRAQHPNKPYSLAGQDLSHGYFYEADFSNTDLSDANLTGACLIGADFRGANLSGANLSKAYIDSADFRQANLIGADLTGTDVQEADFRQALLPAAFEKLPPKASSSVENSTVVRESVGVAATARSAAVGVKAIAQEASVRSAAQSSDAQNDTERDLLERSTGRTLEKIPEKISEKTTATGFKIPVIWWPPVLAVAGILAIATVRLLPGATPTPVATAPNEATNNTVDQAADLSIATDVSVEPAPDSVQSIQSGGASPIGMQPDVQGVQSVQGVQGVQSTASPASDSSSGAVSSEAVTEKLTLVNALPDDSQVWAVAIHTSPNNRAMVMGGDAQGQINVWDGPTGKVLHTLWEHTDTVRALALSSMGNRLVSGGGDGIKVWQPQTGELLYSLDPKAGAPVWAVAVSPDDRTFVSGDYDGNLTAWRLGSGEQLYNLALEGTVWSLAITPDGQSFVSGGSDRIVRHWDMATGELIQEFAGHTDAVRAVAISPDGQTLVSGSWDSTIKLWDMASGELKATLSGHGDRVVSVAISPDGKTLASGSIDNTLKTWNIASQQLTETLDTSDDWVLAVAFDSTAGALVSGGKDQTVKLWQ